MGRYNTPSAAVSVMGVDFSRPFASTSRVRPAFRVQSWLYSVLT